MYETFMCGAVGLLRIVPALYPSKGAENEYISVHDPALTANVTESLCEDPAPKLLKPVIHESESHSVGLQTLNPRFEIGVSLWKPKLLPIKLTICAVSALFMGFVMLIVGALYDKHDDNVPVKLSTVTRVLTELETPAWMRRLRLVSLAHDVD